MPKREENSEWRRLHNEELHTPNTFRVIKYRKLRWAGQCGQNGRKWTLSKF